MADIPHFKSPFRVVGRSAQVIEQDSDENLLGCVSTILRTDRGSRHELPEFGVDDLPFEEPEAIQDMVLEAVREWEPRVQAMARTELEDLVARVEVSIG